MEAIVNSDIVDKLATFLQGARTVAWLARGSFITIGTGTTREAGLPLQLPEDRWARTPVLAFLAQHMELDADAPVYLKKVTLTR